MLDTRFSHLGLRMNEVNSLLVDCDQKDFWIFRLRRLFHFKERRSKRRPFVTENKTKKKVHLNKNWENVLLFWNVKASNWCLHELEHADFCIFRLHAHVASVAALDLAWPLLRRKSVSQVCWHQLLQDSPKNETEYIWKGCMKNHVTAKGAL